MIRDIYQKKIQQQQLKKDAAQASVIASMQTLYDELLQLDARAKPTFFGNILQAICGRPAAPKGIYIWGDVGRGKTILMNMFHQSLPFVKKHRLHFHHFMLEVHADLARLQSDGKRTKNPLRTLARQYADRYHVLCLDEFIVTNITDAMLLYGLLDALFEHGMVLIATSNRVPNDLYLNGLQRERFLPAIELIKTGMRVLHLDSDTDHRRMLLEENNLYHSPLDEDTDEKLMAEFESLAGSDIEHHNHIVVNKREIAFIARADRMIWFSFDVLCHAPRATPDYIEIADEYNIVFLSAVPVMGEDIDDKARRFIYLIDELYDRRVTLVMSAETDMDNLYDGDMLAFAFKRTHSRLVEMQSKEYLEQSSKRSR